MTLHPAVMKNVLTVRLKRDNSIIMAICNISDQTLNHSYYSQSANWPTPQHYQHPA